jgi:predicted DsbA family dithiol-disulfide isomerase
VSIEKIEKNLDVTAKWRCFPLHPEIPDEGISIARLLNTSTEEVRSYMQTLKNKAKDIGLPFGQLQDTYNTRFSQELGLWADSLGRGYAFHKAAFRAYMVEGKNIAKKSVLLELSRSVGLPGAEAEDILEARAFKDAVDKDWDESRRLNIQAVPTLIFNGQRLVGFQTYEKIAQWLSGNLL